MRTRARSNRCGRIQRRGFTLIELMVVITIIAALVALSASAVLKFIQVQQTTNTQSTLDRVQSQLAKAWSKVKDQALKEPIPPAVVGWMQTQWAPNVCLAGTDANATGRMRYLYVKLKLRQAFPMSFLEALTPPTLPAPAGPCVGLPPLPAYQTYLGSLGITTSTLGTLHPTTAPYESSALLLMALQRGVSGAGINPSDLTAGGAAGSLPLTGGSLPYLTDGWGRPIFFTRVPSGNLYLNPAGAMPGANDPGDPQGYFNSPQWVSSVGTQFAALTLQPVLSNASFKLAPIVASGGPVNWVKETSSPSYPNGIPSNFNTITFSTNIQFVPASGVPPAGSTLYLALPPVGNLYMGGAAFEGGAMFSTP